MGDRVREPTGDECSSNAVVETPPGTSGFACWYPQMGGYGSVCVVVFSPGQTCFDAYVWHDGEFPFEHGNPRVLHHCDPEQFVRFGEFVRTRMGL